MRLIVGLGNPRDEYKNTRHNVGYLVVDKLQKLKLPQDILVRKTGVFMNDSGLAVKKLADQYHVAPADVWVIHDDLDIALGAYKIQRGRGPKVHNGVNSVEEALGTEDFWRVRVGVDNRDPEARESGEAYVLQNFNPNEMPTIEKVINDIAREVTHVR